MVLTCVRRHVKANHCSPRCIAVEIAGRAMHDGRRTWYAFERTRTRDVEELVAMSGESVHVGIDQCNGYLCLTSGDLPVRHIARVAIGQVLIFDVSAREFRVLSRSFFEDNYDVLPDIRKGGRRT